MEQDIKILEEWLKELNKIFNKTHINNTKERKVLEHLIKAYKQLEEEKEVWKNNYYEQKEFNNKQALYIMNNFIPISLVKEKIEELKRQRRELGFKTYLRREDMLNDDRAIACEIAVIQELLEKRK